jgi:rare lipoprotein A
VGVLAVRVDLRGKIGRVIQTIKLDEILLVFRRNVFSALFLLLATASLLTGCARSSGDSAEGDGSIVVKRSTVGVASYYSHSFHNRRTANGETFDNNALTAAHPSLPFGTKVRVTNLQNGRSVILRINDRGPFYKSRMIDVSQRAADSLGFKKRGLARVRVDVLGAAPSSFPVYQLASRG